MKYNVYGYLYCIFLIFSLKILQKRFSDFSRDLQQSVDRVENVQSSADSLITAKHTGVNGFTPRLFFIYTLSLFVKLLQMLLIFGNARNLSTAHGCTCRS